MIFKSPWPDASIPETSLTAYVLEGAEGRASKAALIDGPTGQILTYGELRDSIRRVARGLADRGFAKGDVLALYSPNVLGYPIAFHAAASLGGVSTTVSPLYTPEELHRQLLDAKAKFLLTLPALLENAKEACRDTGVEKIFVFGEADGTTPFSALLSSEGEPPEVSVASSDVVALPYSSGTTGLQKGVMLTHRNLVANLAQLEVAMSEDHRDDDVAIGLLPFFHIYAMLVILNYVLRTGMTVVIMPRFDLQQMLELFAKHRVTVAHLVPPIVLALAKHPLVDQYDLSSLRWIFSGAAPLGQEVSQAVTKRLHCDVLQGYGLTETSPVTHLSVPGAGGFKPGSCGRLAPSTECKVVDPATGEELAPGKDGELWMRGPQVMKGYLNKPEATAAAIDADRFFHSGDIGHVDEDGFFYIVDRLKELIKYKGFQVAPAELEALLLSHPAIADAAVIPKPDEEAGEVPKAFVVRRGEVTEQAILDFVAEHVAPYKKIREVEIIEQIPKSASGKILRRVLVDREREKSSGRGRP